MESENAKLESMELQPHSEFENLDDNKLLKPDYDSFSPTPAGIVGFVEQHGGITQVRNWNVGQDPQQLELNPFTPDVVAANSTVNEAFRPELRYLKKITDRDKFPGPEDWNALQGGRPRVFWKPHSPEAKWVVLHVYDEHKDTAKRFRSGSIVGTLSPVVEGMDVSGLIITRKNYKGQKIERHVDVPTFMRRQVHGDECAARSRSVGGKENPPIINQRQYKAYLQKLAGEGYGELRLGIDAEGFKMIPMPRIRPAAPLEINPDP